jgi:hypothetical protein
VQAELQGSWSALKAQLTKSTEEAARRAQRAAAEVIAGAGTMSLEDMIRGRGPTESRYLYIRLREALLEEQTAMREKYDKALSFDDAPLQEEFRRQVDTLKEAAPRKLLERLPGRENDYFAAAATFANWYRDAIGRLRLRIRANALLEFYGVILAELDRRRESSMHFFARIDRIIHSFEDQAVKLLERGAPRREGGESNTFVLDVEVLQDHRTGKRLWEHTYHRVVTRADFQLSDALPRLAAIAGEGGSEQDIQRRIVDSLIETTSRQLRPRIIGSRDSVGLRLDDELATEARLATTYRRFAEDGGPLPPLDTEKWAEEMKRVDDRTIAAYIKDKLDFAASKCQPFITLGAGAPYLPEKLYAVVYPEYRTSLGSALSQLSELPMDSGQVIDSEDPHSIVFYRAQLGCALHAVKSLDEYERRYEVVKQGELAAGSKVPGQQPGTPQIPLHQDRNWEGAPDKASELFRISIEGVKANQSKLAWFKSRQAHAAAEGAAAMIEDEMRDFTLGIAFGHILYRRTAEAGDGWYLVDDSLEETRQRLGKFRDQAFESYRNRNRAQKDWLRKMWTDNFKALEQDRNTAELAKIFDRHSQTIEGQLKNSDHAGGAPLSAHLEREKAVVTAFRREKSI